MTGGSIGFVVRSQVSFPRLVDQVIARPPASAMIVSVGFLSAFDANGAPSHRNRFFTSHVWFH